MKAFKPSESLSVKIIFSVFIALLTFLSGCNSKPGNKAEGSDKVIPDKSVSTDVINQGKAAAVNTLAADSVQLLLKGKWLREDGTYTLEIFSVSADGVMDAGYFNPGPINVGKSGWMISQDIIMLEIIMKDVNYPGSKYNLFYDKISGCLIGNYFQAVQGINYDVIFRRQK